MRTIKQKTHNAIRHGAAWFGAAGISGGISIWFLIEFIRSIL